MVEPHLFSGTLRFNLDPFNEHTDMELWAALGHAHIRDHVERLELGLLSAVEEGGRNFSAGQRQLLSLSRAILRRCPIVLMDEVSASIDYATDELIQDTIRQSEALRHSTIFTIAHRLRTIADSDTILVIGAGELLEVGAPLELLQREDSQFKSLVEESNEFEDILGIAQQKWSTTH
jgi:ATP-binding cassette subfamily C (CFTR/MRP) protein 1